MSVRPESVTEGRVLPGHGSTALTGRVVALLAGLSAIGILSTNIILPAFPAIGQQLGVSSRELGLTLSSFFITLRSRNCW